MFVPLAVCVYVVGVAGSIYAIHRAPADQLTTVVPLALSIIVGGGLKVINILQNRATDRKVTEDVKTTKEVAGQVGEVHLLVNGGLHDRIKAAVREVLAEKDEKTGK